MDKEQIIEALKTLYERALNQNNISLCFEILQEIIAVKRIWLQNKLIPHTQRMVYEEKEETMHDTLKQALSRVATLNAIADEVFERIPNIPNQNFLNDIEKCLNILQKIEAVKKTL